MLPGQAPHSTVVSHVDLAAPPTGLSAGPGAGLTIRVEPAGQLLYWDSAGGRLHLVLPEGAAVTFSACEDTLAFSQPSNNGVVIMMERRAGGS